ncbi:MAG: hypothetical protein JWP63_3812 [Candidatus Solibacter sp.]|nr:hypothetical protein [Candidatus Solibacter sp.]
MPVILWLPPLAAFVISFVTSMAGISGAVLLAPFQMSFLGAAGPAVSATSLLFNVIATPGAVYRYFREGRLVFPLAMLLTAGTVPGTLLGVWIRVHWLSDANRFKIFCALLLLYLGIRLLLDKPRENAAPSGSDWVARSGHASWRTLILEFHGARYECKTVAISVVSFAVGILGGAYGIGGGSILAPFLVTIVGLPLYAVSGPTLLATFVTSAVGVAFYGRLNAGPDQQLALLMGAGGVVGMYCGARFQRHVPVRLLQRILGTVLIAVSVSYLSAAWR